MSNFTRSLQGAVLMGLAAVSAFPGMASDEVFGAMEPTLRIAAKGIEAGACASVTTMPVTDMRKVSETPITVAPEGKYVPCYVDYSMCWFQAAGGGGLAGFPLMGKPMHYVVTEDNDFYLYNPVFLRPFDGDDLQLGAYVKGKLEGNKVTFHYPQAVGEIDVYGNGEVIEMAYINKMEMITDLDGNNAFVNLAEKDNFQTYTLDENGNLMMDGMTEAYQDIIGLSTADGAWTGYGTWQWNANTIDPTPLTPPEGLDVKRYLIKDDFGSGFVKIGIDGDDFWIQGLSRTYLPNAWAKGKVEGTTITIPRCEFIGEVTSVGEYAWVAGNLFAEDVEYNENGEAIVSPSTLMDLTFEANEDFSEFTAKRGVVINPNTKIYYALESYSHVKISAMPEGFTPTPQPATITSFNVKEDGTADLWFRYGRNTEDGIPLETANLYYEIYLPDGELYTFTPETYPQLTEPMSLIPRGCYINGVFLAQGSNINVQLNVPDINNVGVKTVYVADGERYEAETVYLAPVNVASMEVGQDGKTEFFTLQGTKVSNPEKGCFIKVTTLSDGFRKIQKVIF